MGDKEVLGFTVISSDEIVDSDDRELVNASEADIRKDCDTSVSGDSKVVEETDSGADRGHNKQETLCKQYEGGVELSEEKQGPITMIFNNDNDNEIINDKIETTIRNMYSKRESVLQKLQEKMEEIEEAEKQEKTNQRSFERGLRDYCDTVHEKDPRSFFKLYHEEKIAAIQYQSLKREKDIWREEDLDRDALMEYYERKAYERTDNEHKEIQKMMQECHFQDDQ